MAATRTRATGARLLIAGLAMAVAGCSTIKDVIVGSDGQAGAGKPITGFIGGVVADEPAAALAGRDVLALGGTAADAAVAVGFTLSVTYPSRASLGAGGACLAYSPSQTGAGGGVPEAIVFMPLASTTTAANADRPAAIPMLPRGLFALHARYGRRPFETLIASAEELARSGTPASGAFVRDLTLVSAPLLADPAARAIFAPHGKLLTEGATMVQPDLASTLSQLRIAGVGSLYQGVMAQQFALAADRAGGGLVAGDMRGALPKTLPPIVVTAGNDRAAFLPPPADGGLAAAAAFEVLRTDPTAIPAADARAIATAARWRAGGITADALLANPPPDGTLPPLPASTTFVTLDRDGHAVVCGLTMDNLFGIGRVAPGTGVVLAASPAAAPQPLLAAGLAWNAKLGAFRAAAGGSGQNEAAVAAALGLSNALSNRAPLAGGAPSPGSTNVIACSRYLPGAASSCQWAADSRGLGLAVGSN